MAITEGSLERFERRPFEHDGVRYDTFRRGAGPGIVLLHELPNVTPLVLGLAERVAAAGFYVVVPSLLGTPGQKYNPLSAAVAVARICLRKEFKALAAEESGTIVVWLRALCRHVYEETRNQGVVAQGVGVIGLCFSGNFALAAMLDPADKVLASVLAEPSLPLALGKKRRCALHLSPKELSAIRERVEREDLGVLGCRFTNDRRSPLERFVRLREELGDHFEGVEIPSPDERFAIPSSAHSVLTMHYCDAPEHPTRRALEQVMTFLKQRL